MKKVIDDIKAKLAEMDASLNWHHMKLGEHETYMRETRANINALVDKRNSYAIALAVLIGVDSQNERLPL